jgi:ABC-type oligopeptide transport system substrate-binding subunit
LKINHLKTKWAIGVFLTFSIFGLARASFAALASNQIVIYLPKEPATLDWNISNRRIDELLIFNLHEGLIEAGSDHQPKPILATRWEVSSDGKTYSFFLRNDAKWSDGKKVVAQDFVDSWHRLISPVTATSNGYFLLDVVGAEDFYKGVASDFSQVGIKAVNETTIQVKLKKPMWNWIWNFAEPATFPIRQDLIDKHGAKFWTAPGNLITAGPYVLESHDLDSGYVLKRNSFYAGHTGNITAIRYKIIPDADAVAAFAKGQFDLACYLSGAEKFSKDAAPFLKWSVARTTKRLDYNVKRFPIGIKEVRQGIAEAIDRKQLAVALGAGMTEGTSGASPSMSTYSKRIGLPFNPTAAKGLLATAGSEVLQLEIVVPLFDEHAPENLKAAEIIQEMLTKNLHATVTLQKAETEQLYSLLRDTLGYSLVLRDWTGTNDPDEFYSFYASQSKKSTSWSSPEYDKLLDQSRAEKDSGKRMLIYQLMDKMLVNDQVAVTPLFYESDASLVSPRISGFDKASPTPCQVRDLDKR